MRNGGKGDVGVKRSEDGQSSDACECDVIKITEIGKTHGGASS